ncbi:MAG: PQQ-like beta-propeller repeat protein [Planctomycetes bacterium]|nr:PQQ-like beta-propeller repeat protein [Planctomycetota bacterium]MBL7044213.1 PQQ-like beta-propeller repeat protein [Pirellulaceae bacterium]
MNEKRTIVVVTASIFAVAIIWAGRLPGAEDGSSPEWPDFHSPGRTNISPEKGLLKKWPEEGPRLLWKYSSCGEGYSGVAIAEGKIFTAGDFDDREMILALNMDGEPLWKAPNGQAWRGSSPGSRTTPTYSEGTLYQMNPHGRLAAYEAKTGKPVWAIDLKAEFDASFGWWALSENLVVDGNKVLCMPGGPKGRVVALDKHTGKTVWANTEIEHSAAYCSPMVTTYRDVRQLITMTQKSVVALDVETGELVWSAPFVPRSPQNSLTPVFHGGYVYVACGHSSGGTLLKIDPDTKSAPTVWYREDLDDCHSGALLIDGRLYGCSCRAGGRQFYCVDFMTGKTIKADKTLGKVGITAADGMLYCLGYRGTMSLMALTADGFEIVSQFELPRRPPNSYLAHPIVCGGRLYLRCGQDLYAYDIRAK